MKTIELALFLALSLWAADTKDAKGEPDDKKTDATVKLKVSLDKPAAPTLPVRYAFTVTLPSYCIAQGFDAPRPPSQKIHCSEDGVNFEKVYPSADNIVDALKTATQYTIQKGDNTRLLFFCAAKSCSPGDEAAMRAAVAELSHTPSPRYFHDVPVPPHVDPELLAESIPSFTEGAVTGRVLPSGQFIRLETDQKLDNPTKNDLIDKIWNATNATLNALAPYVPGVTAKRIELPTFCLSGTLTDPPAAADQCTGAPQRLVAAANAAEIATALTGDKIKVIADSAASLIVSCGAEKCDSKAIQMLEASATEMAHPKPAYTRDLAVLTGTASSASADIARWSKGAIAADIISADSIRLKSDAPIDAADITALDDRLRDAGFGPAAIAPANRLFYTDAGAVVARLSTIPTPAASAASSAAPTSSAPSTYGMGMTSVGDSVVLSGSTSVSDGQRVRLLTLLDLPRPEVLMNLWSLQESNPNGKELASNASLIRSTVALHNEALQNAIEYGWSYLSRRMKEDSYFDGDFKNYLTQRYVADSKPCTDPAKPGPGCVGGENRKNWEFCPPSQYCLGYSGAFEPIRPTLTNILLGLMASKDPVKAVFTTLGCMEGKFEVYGEDCFKDRQAIALLPLFTEKSAGRSAGSLASSDASAQQCLRAERQKSLDKSVKGLNEPSCEDLDRAALEAQRICRVRVALPLSCFTIQAAQSFVPFHGFSTFTARELNGLAEENIPAALETVKSREFASNAGQVDILTAHERSFSASPLGLLRAATTNFLFNYKMAQQFPKEFSPYLLSHSAQELNAEFNPLVVAFNQDVSVFSEDLRQAVESKLSEGHWRNLWDPHNKSFLADGSVTVRGISGVESLVDTETMSAFSAPQYQTLPDVLNNLAGLTSGPAAPAAGTTTSSSTSVTSGDTTTTTSTTAPAEASGAGPLSSSLTSILPSVLSRASLPVALASAVLPTPATAQIGRQLTLRVTPHTLPGASSAELDVNLIAQEDSPPTLYSDHGATKNTDPISRVAKHNVVSRVRVESVKLFEVSSFSALIQRPRQNVPFLPIPFVEVPVIGDLLSIPLPGAKVYHRSTAIISAVIVPTAADLAYGLEFHGDREVVEKSNSERYFMKVTSQDQLPWEQRRLYGFNQAMANCLAAKRVPEDPNAQATNSKNPNVPNPACAGITFNLIAPDR